MATQAGKKLARRAVLSELSNLDLTPVRLSELSGLDYGTVGDFLAGRRWPQINTLGKIDAALGWKPGSLASLAAGLLDEPEREAGADSAGQGGPDDTITFRREPGMTDEEWSEMKQYLTLGHHWKLMDLELYETKSS